MKIKLGVIFGGKSVEHEISVISAIQAIGYIDTEKYDIIPIYVTKRNEFYVGEGIGCIDSYKNIEKLLKESQRVVLINDNNKVNIVKYPITMFKSVIDYIDIAFPIVHGTNVEDGALQGYLRTLSLPFVGCDVTAAAVCMDKYVTKTVLRDNNIPVLDCRCFITSDYRNGKQMLDEIEKSFSYPVIIKPVNLGSSIGITKVTDRESLVDALNTAFAYAGKVLVEPCIRNLKEINCSVLGDEEKAEASECEEPINSDEILSYEDKYVSGGTKTGGSKGMASTKRKIPADITPEQRELIRSYAVKAFQCIGCNGVARIDFIIDNDTNEIWLNELNTIPGSLSFYLWEPLGVKYPELIERLIELTLKRMRAEDNITYAFKTNVLQCNGLSGSKGSKH